MSEEKKRAAHPLDLPAMAAFAANYGLSGDQAARRWGTAVSSVREHWRMIADAAITASGLGDALTELAAQPQPAPELAAAMAALQRDLADAEAEIGRWPRCPSGCRCRVGTNDADALECGCDGPCTTGWDAPAAQHDQLRDRLATLAASLDADALATQPSKKSQIQADAARRIREALA